MGDAVAQMLRKTCKSDAGGHPPRRRTEKMTGEAMKLRIREVIARVADGALFGDALDDAGLSPSQFFRALRCKRNERLQTQFDEAREISRKYLCERAMDFYRVCIGVPASARSAAEGEATGGQQNGNGGGPGSRRRNGELRITSVRLRAVHDFLSCEGRFSSNGQAGDADTDDADALERVIRSFHEHKGNETDAVEE